MAEARRAQELDPLSPDVVSEVGNTYFFMRRYDEALSQYQNALELNPNVSVIRAVLGLTYGMKKMYPEAIAEFDKIPDQDKSVSSENQFVASQLGWLYAIAGRRGEALKIARQFEELSLHSYVDFYFVAGIYAALEDKDEAFRLLQKAYEQHEAGIQYLAIDVPWYGLRSDQRYTGLIHRMALPQPN